MKHELLQVNLFYTVEEMKWQTGKTPGGPTGLCHNVMLGALTGVEQDFHTRFKTGHEQREKEHRAGLQRYPVVIYEMPQAEAAQIVLEESEPRGLGIDALLVGGYVRGYTGRHAVALVPDDGKPPYGIVDSLEPHAIRMARTTGEVHDYLTERFNTDLSMDFSVVPNDHERERRTGRPLGLQIVRIHDQVEVPAPIRIVDGMDVLDLRGVSS